MKRFTNNIVSIKRGDADVDKVYKGAVQIFPDDETFIEATGGDILEYELNGDFYRSHTFNSTGTFEVTQIGEGDNNEIDVVVVAGGGGGSGGGGGGGYFTMDKILATLKSYNVIVGSGASRKRSLQNQVANSGNNSSFDNIQSEGGKGAFNAEVINIREGGDGGSGGAASGSSNQLVGDGGSDGSDGGPGQRGDGGSGQGTPTSTNIRTGVLQFFSGGGGAGIFSGTPGVGGIGGGGDGSNTGAGGDGIINTGGGGGGSKTVGSGAEDGGAGGSGIVIVRYKIKELT
jgi:hypothetical protein